MEIVVNGPAGGDRGYWGTRLYLTLTRLVYQWDADPDRDDMGAPAVLAVSDQYGEELLLRTGTHRQAERAAVKFQFELDSLGEAAFRRRYRLRGWTGSSRS